MKLKLSLGWIVCLSLSSCGSMSKDAKTLMDHGSYREAVEAWDKVLKQNPNDEEAQRLRLAARNELLNEELVTFKSLLDSHQTLNAFEHLRKLNDQRNAWNQNIGPNSGYYLKQQSERLYGQYLEMLNQENQGARPLKSVYLEKRYRDLLPTEKIESEKMSLKIRAELGLKKCDMLDRNSLTQDSLRLYAIAVCKVFGKGIGLSPAAEKRLKDRLIKIPNPVSKVSGLSDSENQAFALAIRKELPRFPQFSLNGNTDAQLNFSGSLSLTRSETPVTMSHSYLVKIPYTEFRTVKNTRSHPYTESETRCDATGSNCQIQSVIKYHEVDEFETVTETAFRDEPRVHIFTGTELKQKIGFTVMTQFASQSFKLEPVFQDSFEEVIQVHHENLPHLGLSPQVGALKSKEKFMQEMLPGMITQLRDHFESWWVENRCKDGPGNQHWQSGNRAIECLRSKQGLSASWVQKWFEVETGLGAEQVIETTGELPYL